MQQPTVHSLTNPQIERYSRQLLLNQIGVAGQEKLSKSSVLVVGAGGLGSPIIQYLAAAGVGKIGVIDYDVVEGSNLQRQVIHNESNINKPKVQSALEYIKNLNSMIETVGYNLLLDSTNCLQIIEQYDVIVDGTDNVATRYLLNDASVLKNKPLVSAGALRMDGQINVYNYKNGPCYRCIYPIPPPAEFVTNCNEGGVLGVVTGIVGSIQALEVIKIIVGIDPQCHGKMLVFDGLSGFKTIKLRGRNVNCSVCGNNPTIHKLQDYVLLCGSGPDDKVQNLRMLEAKDRITVHEFQKLKESECIVLDVRQKSEIDIGHLKGSIFIELKKLKENIETVKDLQGPKLLPIYVLCKHGNDSQLAVNLLKEHGFNNVFDVIGGLWEWSHKVDNAFPKY